MNNPSESLSFPQAISATQTLMEQMKIGNLTEDEIAAKLSSLLSNKQGGRGFFVAYLTSDLSLADRPSPGVIRGLKASSEISTELLVKNLAMSSAMVVAHNRNGDREGVAGSQKVWRRTLNTIEQLKSQSIQSELQKLNLTIQSGGGEYEEFLKRWNYDEEQRKAIQKSIANLAYLT